ncbi:MAG: hypothetical protein AAF711_05030 [Planctomycetota bacterium]
MDESNPKPSGNGAFPTTHWTIVSAIREASQGERNRILQQFLDAYQEAFRFHLCFGVGIKNEHDLEDVLQGFITDKFIAKSILDYVKKDGGRLRDYLRRSLENYVYSQHRSKADKAWDRRETHDHLLNNSAADDQDPCPFDVAWARSIMVEAIIRTKDQFFYGKRPHVWDVLDMRHLRPIFLGSEPTDYAELSTLLGLEVKVIQNCRVTALRALNKHLSNIISQYAGDNQDDIDEELRLLNSIMRTAGVLGSFDKDILE